MKRRMMLISLCAFLACALVFAVLPSLGRAADEPPASDVAAQEVANDEEAADVAEDADAAEDDEVAANEDESAIVLDEEPQETTTPVVDSTPQSSVEKEPTIEPESTTEAQKQVQGVTSATVAYHTHVQDYGWEKTWAKNGAQSGTTGQAKRLEGIEIAVKVPGVSGGIRYKTHVQDIGWQDWKHDGAMSGTTGQAKRLEGIYIELTGDLAKQYDVWYRVHCQDYGWMGWAKNGALAGTTGQAKRLEGIEIKLLKKGTTTVVPIAGALVNYNVHAQDYGWMGTEADGAMAGTTGEAKRLEGINIKLGSSVSGGIEYRTHVQDLGWETSWKSNGAMSGTSGKAKRLEAIQIQLTGNAANKYDVWYRVHAQDYGWLGWAENGEAAGSSGHAKRLEGIEIKLLTKGSAAPGTTARHMVADSLIYLDAGHGPSGSVGYDEGASGSGYKEADLTKWLVNRTAEIAKKTYGLNVYNNVNCNVYYANRQAHAYSVGATSFVSIHFNAASSAAYGTESYIYKGYGQYTGAAAPRSDLLQQIMHKRVVGALGLYDRGMRTEAFAVTNGAKTGIPATLIEVCFITNANDMKTYMAKREQVAQALAAGLNEAYQNGF